MKQKLCRLLPLFLCILYLTGCGYAEPEKAVHRELDLIRKLDEATIKAFVSYEDIRIATGETPDIGTETTEAVKLFFKNFKYRIRSSSLGEDGNTAAVELRITNLDAEQLAKDLCRSMIRHSFDYGSQENNPGGLNSSFALMKECLESNTYESRTTPATVHLTKQDGEWVIQESPQLEDELTGGLVTYLNDKYLLSPQEVLDITLEPFRSFSAAQWQNYLGIDDVFSIGNELSDKLDALLFAQLEQFFDYEISDVTQDGDTARVLLNVTSLDLASVIDEYRRQLLLYAQTTESIRATDEELTKKTSEILLQALQENNSAAVRTIEVTLTNNGYTWEAILGDSFSDALLGGLQNAVSMLNEN